jgi:hypothetical protein
MLQMIQMLRFSYRIIAATCCRYPSLCVPLGLPVAAEGAFHSLLYSDIPF